MKKIINVQNLHKSFITKAGSNHVLRGVNLDVEKGSIFALLGSNGAGKTTAIRILSTLLKADSGKASICGYDVSKKADAEKVRAKISLTGQFAAVDEELSGIENLRLIGQLQRLPNTNVKANELLKQFDLEDAANRQAKTYSGGMRRRLDIAMSLMGTPEVLFLDEPTTGLDPQNRISMWNMVKDLSDKGVTILLTTQYLEEAEYLADKIAILHEGKIIAEGTLEDLQKLFPPAKKEYVEVRPSLEEIFLKIIGADATEKEDA
ncbi:MAG: ATP-binding cassette domain-containing protein [Oscillospiraceae bacterium]|nr:ATP-binding cassette domain-containing protein [Oscillospiraceae bacterium]